MDPDAVSITGPSLNERLSSLDNLESKIFTLLEQAKNCLVEITKEKGVKKDDHVTTLFQSLKDIERELGEHIDYLSNVCIGSAHEGSTFLHQEQVRTAQANAFRLFKQLQVMHKSLLSDR